MKIGARSAVRGAWREKHGARCAVRGAPVARPDGLSIAVLGGTFDPVHEGHLALARAALRRLPVDLVLFVPAKRSPFKSTATLAPPAERVRLLDLALGSNRRFAISRAEVRPGRRGNYMIDTLSEIRREWRPSKLWLLMGMDNLAGFPRWRAPHAILRLCRLGVASRPGCPRPELPDWLEAACDFLPLRRTVSSTALRAALRRASARALKYPAGGPLSALPPSVRSRLAEIPFYRESQIRPLSRPQGRAQDAPRREEKGRRAPGR